jgi:hypothetical protein
MERASATCSFAQTLSRAYQRRFYEKNWQIQRWKPSPWQDRVE